MKTSTKIMLLLLINYSMSIEEDKYKEVYDSGVSIEEVSKRNARLKISGYCVVIGIFVAIIILLNIPR